MGLYISPKLNVKATLGLLLCSYHRQRVAGHLSRGKGHEAEEKQLGVAVVGRIISGPVHNGLE